MTTGTEAVDRFAARAALARYAADDYREARRRELALMAGIVRRPLPRPKPRPRPSRGPGHWRALKPRPGEAARLAWVPAPAVTASVAAYRAAPVRAGTAADGMAYDLSRTVRF